MRILTGILAAGLLAGVSTAAMAETNGWYVGAEAGGNYVPDTKIKDSSGSATFKNDFGYAILGNVGYGFGPVRVEGEIGWRSNSVDKVKSGY